MKVDVQYPKELHKYHNELPLLAGRIKMGKVEKLVPNLKHKNTEVVHTKELEQPLKYGGLSPKKVDQVVRFEQN